MEHSQLQQLCGELKNILLISWEDENTEAKVKNAVTSANAHIESLTGTTPEYDKNGFAKGVLLNCARYYYSNIPEYFEDNFQKEILRLQFEEAVRMDGEE